MPASFGRRSVTKSSYIAWPKTRRSGAPVGGEGRVGRRALRLGQHGHARGRRGRERGVGPPRGCRHGWRRGVGVRRCAGEALHRRHVKAVAIAEQSRSASPTWREDPRPGMSTTSGFTRRRGRRGARPHRLLLSLERPHTRNASTAAIRARPRPISLAGPAPLASRIAHRVARLEVAAHAQDADRQDAAAVALHPPRRRRRRGSGRRAGAG